MRRFGVTAIAATTWMVLALPAHAHGIGGRQDLPVPVEFFVIGAVVVLILSFAALAVLWPSPRLQDPLVEHAVAGPVWRLARHLLATLGVVFLFLVVVGGFIGGQSSSDNPAPVIVFVVFWLVLPFASAVVGDLYPVTDPWTRLGDWVGLRRGERTVSMVPAAAVLFAFAWFELVSPYRDPKHVAMAVVAYTIYLIVMRVAGRHPSDVDGFRAYNELLGALAPWSRYEDGTVARRGWLRALPHIAERPGLVGVVVIAIGTVTYDGISVNSWWSDAFELPMSRAVFELGFPSAVANASASTVAMAGTISVIGVAYLGASALAARLGGTGNARSVARRFAHTLVPIAFAYAFAHYFTLILFEGQLLISTLSDPFGRGWDLFGTADRTISYALIQGSTVWVWYVQVAVIVLGHLAGVVLAHDRALADFRGLRAVRSQYAMLVLMVLLTGLGLIILAAG